MKKKKPISTAGAIFLTIFCLFTILGVGLAILFAQCATANHSPP